MRILKFSIIVFCLLWLASCASVSTTQQAVPQKQTPAPSWGSRVGVLSNVQDWDLKALIAIRNQKKTRDDITANLQWQQHQQQYSILLFGPLGASATKLTGNNQGVKLETADGKIVTASTPERLVAEQTNWILPVSSLYYWIRGLPVPAQPAKKQFDAENRLTALQQQGWQIQFLSYTSVNQIDLPNKIFLFNPDLNVKIVIKQWKIS